jgi:START domain-containing protein
VPRSLVACLLSCLLGGAAGAEKPAPGPWTKVTEQAGIIVHRRTVATSKLAEFRSRGIIEAPLPTVLAVIRDHSHAKQLNDRNMESRTLERPDAKTEIVYERSSAPWPVSDRDVVLRVDVEYDPSQRQVRILLHGIDYPKKPPVPGVVRMPFLEGHWFLTAEHGGAWTHLEYQMHADPGGMIPESIANSGSKNVPYTTLVGVREQVKKHASADLEREYAAMPEVQAVVAAAANPSP